MSGFPHRHIYKQGVIDSAELRSIWEREVAEVRKQKRQELLDQQRDLYPSELPGPSAADDPAPESPEAIAGEKRAAFMAEKMMQCLKDIDVKKQILSAQRVRSLLRAGHTISQDELVRCGTFFGLLEVLRTAPNCTLQFELAWIFTTLTCRSPQYISEIVSVGAIEVLVASLENQCQDVRAQVLWVIGNIAKTSPEYRDRVLDAGIMVPVIRVLRPNTNTPVIRNAVWLISNICAGTLSQSVFVKVQPALIVLTRLLFHKDATVVAECCRALGLLSNGPKEQVQTIIQAGVCRGLVFLLRNEHPIVVSGSLKAMGNILLGEDKNTEAFLIFPALPNLLNLLSSPHGTIKKEASWVISNITAGNKNHIEAVKKANIFPALLEILIQSPDINIRKQAIWAISNALTGGTPEHVKYLAELGSIKPLCDHLTVVDPEITLVVLRGLDNILKLGKEYAKEKNANPYAIEVEKCNGLDKIEDLQTHQNDEIYQKALGLLENFFDVQE